MPSRFDDAELRRCQCRFIARPFVPFTTFDDGTSSSFAIIYRSHRAYYEYYQTGIEFR